MKKLFSFLLLSLILINLNAQLPKFNKESTIDTLRVSLNVSEHIDIILKEKLTRTFEERITQFNANNNVFKLLIDSSKIKNYTFIDIGEIKYVTPKKSIWTTVLDLGLIAGDIGLISIGFVPILYPFLFPVTQSNVTLDLSESIVDSKNKANHLSVAPSGYFTSVEKQKDKFNKKFGKQIDRYLWKLNRQQTKNKSSN